MSMQKLRAGALYMPLPIVGPANVSILQQCRMLESIVGATILDKCLEYPDDAIHLVKAQKPQILLDNILSVILTIPDKNTNLNISVS